MWRGFSWKFHVISRHKSTPNSMTIPCHLSRFYLFSMLEHDTDFGQVQVMEFPWHLLRKWWDFHWIWSHFWPNCRQKDMRKSVSHFLQGWQHKIAQKLKVALYILYFSSIWRFFGYFLLKYQLLNSKCY